MAYASMTVAEPMPGMQQQWSAPASPTYQESQGQVNYFGNMKNPGWHPGAFQDNRPYNNRAKPQWNGSKRRQQNNQPPPPPPPPPIECLRSPPPSPISSFNPACPPSPISSFNAACPPSPISSFNAAGPVDFHLADEPVTVKLENLPHALCRVNFLEAMLDQAGLTHTVEGCFLGQDQDTGSALIRLSNQNAAQMCLEHFGGCCWDKSGTPVLAQILDGGNKQVSQGQISPPVTPNNRRQAKPNAGNMTPGSGKARKPPRTKISNEPLSPFMNTMTPVNTMIPWAEPQPPQLLLMVGQNPWSEIGQDYKFDENLRQETEEASTRAGSSGRASHDSAGCGYDTDDGF